MLRYFDCPFPRPLVRKSLERMRSAARPPSRPAADGAGHATPAALVAAERGRRGLRVSSSRLGHMVAKLLDALHAAHPSETRLAALAAAQIEAPLSPAAHTIAAARRQQRALSLQHLARDAQTLASLGGHDAAGPGTPQHRRQ